MKKSFIHLKKYKEKRFNKRVLEGVVEEWDFKRGGRGKKLKNKKLLKMIIFKLSNSTVLFFKSYV